MTTRTPVIAGTATLSTVVRGIPFIPASTPLTRLNYVDGRTLRAADLTLEQRGQRAHVEAVGRAGGWGVVDGLDVGRTGETLTIGPGSAIDPAGRVLLLTEKVNLVVAELLAATNPATPSAGQLSAAQLSAGSAGFGPCEISTVTTAVLPGIGLYLLTIGWVEGFCGHQETFGSPCGACVGEPARPYGIDGVVFRLRPLTLRRPWAPGPGMGDEFLRSLVASAYFADEQDAARWPMSAALLASPRWRDGTEPAAGPAGSEVPLGVLVRRGAATLFDDSWTARRERLDNPGRPAFDNRIGARPRAVFVAQIDQFQAQLAPLAGLLSGVPNAQLRNAGFAELPPCGFLPVNPSAPLAPQAAALFGPGVDTALIAVPRDRIAHEIESAAHRDRIQLVAEAVSDRPRQPVDILVPDGVAHTAPTDAGRLFAADATIADRTNSITFVGSGRRLDGDDSSIDLWAAAIAGVSNAENARDFVSRIGETAGSGNEGPPVPAPGAAPLDNEMLQFAARLATERVRSTGRTDSADFARLFGARDSKPIAAIAAFHADRAPWAPDSGNGFIVTFALEITAPTGPSVVGMTTTALVIRGVMTQAQVEPGQPRQWDFVGSLVVRSGLVIANTPVTGRISGSSRHGEWTFSFGSDGTFVVVLAEKGSPQERISFRKGDRLDVELIADPDIADRTDEHRVGAERALEILGLTKSDADRNTWRKNLFGPDPDGLATGTVTGVADWVAFRRRWLEPTTTIVVTKPPAPTLRTVDLFVVEADTSDGAEAVVQGLIGAAPFQFKETFAGRADFVAGSADWPDTSAEIVLRSIAGVTKANTLFAAGYNPPLLPAPEGRAERIAQALTGVALDPSFRIFRLATDHTATPGADGAIVLIMLSSDRPAPPMVMEFYRTPAAGPGWPRVSTTLTGGTATDLNRLIQGQTVTPLGQIDSQTQDLQTTVQSLSTQVGRQTLVKPTPILWIDAALSAAGAVRMRNLAAKLLDQLVGPNGQSLRIGAERIVSRDTDEVRGWRARLIFGVGRPG